MRKLISLLAAGLVMLGAASLPACASVGTGAPRVNVHDVQRMAAFLHGMSGAEDLADADYDKNGDGRWDVFDLALMKREAAAETSGSQSTSIVVYFSRTGNTERIAEMLTALTGADSYVIEAAVPYTDDDIAYNVSGCRANVEQNDKTVRPAIAEPLDSLDGYDTVFLGYPIWWGEEPRIIDTFLETYDLSEKTVVPFCTSASSGIAASEHDIAALVPIGTQLPGKRFSATATQADVQAWYDTLDLPKADPQLQIQIGDTTLTASLADTAAAAELASKLREGPVTVTLGEYGGFEKVGALPWTLTASDERIEGAPGDVLLYQGGQMTVFYGTNAWSYTRLAHIDIPQAELADILGNGDVTAVLSVR